MRLPSLRAAGRPFNTKRSSLNYLIRGIQSSSVPKGDVGARRKAIRTTTRLSELPKTRLSELGQAVPPLDAWSDRAANSVRRQVTIKPIKTKVDPSDSHKLVVEEENPESSHLNEEEEIRQAIATGVIPASALAKEVYLNWRRFPDCILLTRVGKFYESYFEPARELSSILGIKLAFKKYDEGHFPFAGFPVIRLDKYLKILVQDLGHTVVLVEEYDSEGALAEVGKKITVSSGPKERRVYRVVTPGTMVDEGWLNGDESRYLLAIAVGREWDETAEGDEVALSLAYADPSTGEFFTKETTLAQMEDELARIAPREVVLDRRLKDSWKAQVDSNDGKRGMDGLFSLLRILGVYVSFADPYRPPPSWGASSPAERVPARPTASESQAISLLRHHLQYALRETMPALAEPDRQFNSSFMQIDAATLQALEIRHALRPGGLLSTGDTAVSPISTRGTLLSVISKTITSSGHRLLIRTLTAPSTDLGVINSRLKMVQAFVKRQDLREELRGMLKNTGDVMRIIQRFRGQRGDGRDVWDVGRWIRSVDKMQGVIRQEIDIEVRNQRRSSGEIGSEGAKRLQALTGSFVPLSDLAERIETSIDEDAIMFGIEGEVEEDVEPVEGDLGEESSGDGEVEVIKESRKDRAQREREEREAAARYILPSFSAQLQVLHDEIASIKMQRDKMQLELRKRFDTPSLTLEKGTRYGYHLSINRSEAVKVIKARSLENIGGTKTSKAYFAFGPWSALGAKTEMAVENLLNAQRKAFRDLRSMIVERSEAIQRNAELVDEMDMSLSFAQNAVEMDWVRPVLDSSTNLDIVAGRHPSIETSLLTSSRSFTPNTTHMDESSHLQIITGPNQGGKSTLLRQTAIIAILAQSGSFVPAQQAKIGIVDRVFSRVGARDDLWRDRSTFMLEMVETANILKHATNRSLVIMDEIGRGTTLQAGVSIAYATLDHILTHVKCRTLFATHYHELGHMLGYEDPQIDASEDLLSHGGAKPGVSFWCTDVDEVDGAFSYSYKLRPGINHNSHAIKAARLAGMPESFLQVAESTLKTVQSTGKFDPPNNQ